MSWNRDDIDAVVDALDRIADALEDIAPEQKPIRPEDFKLRPLDETVFKDLAKTFSEIPFRFDLPKKPTMPMKQFDITFRNGHFLSVTAEYMHVPLNPEPGELVEFTTDEYRVALVDGSEILSVAIQHLSTEVPS